MQHSQIPFHQRQHVSMPGPMPRILFQWHFFIPSLMQTMLSQLSPVLHTRQLLPVWTELHSLLQLLHRRYVHKRMSYRLLPDSNPIRLCLLWSLFIKLPQVHRLAPMSYLQGHSHSSERPLCTSQLRQLRLMWLNRDPGNLQELYHAILLVQGQVCWHLPGLLLCNHKPNLSR